jgi:hypothetical protein
MPRDVQARERLREAQKAEARAVSAVCAAQDALAAAGRKRDRAVAAADAILAKAEQAVAVAHADLVEISGLARAAGLLGTDKASLRKARMQAAARTPQGQAS